MDDFPASLSLPWLAAGGPGAVIGAMTQTLPVWRNDRDVVAMLDRASDQQRFSQTTAPLRRWANGKGEVGRWAAATEELQRLRADRSGRTKVRAARETAEGLLPAAQREYAQARQGVAEWFASSTKSPAATNGPVRVGKW